MWIDTRECVPLEDGFYLVQTIHGDTYGFQYTHEGGWNTEYVDGKLQDKHTINSGYVARWYKAEKPKPIPKAWLEEYLNDFRERRGRCDTEQDTR